jgi:thioredoxin 1
MNRWMVLISCAALAVSAVAAELPYDEHADANAQLQQALAQARSDHKDIMLVFGANWCEDCRELDHALHGSSAALVANRFQIVKIDVGNFDKNLDIANHYGNPIAKGIPAVVVLSSTNDILYSTKGGELANARRMGDTGIYDFLSHNLSPH